MTRSGQYQVGHSQNFLTNHALVRELVAKSGIDRHDTVLEIGPGKGIITRALAERAGHVIAIEQDEHLAGQLVRPGALPGNVTVVLGDALHAQLPVSPFRVFANIPFRHTAAFVGKLTTGIAPPADSWLVVQREAAERFITGEQSTMQAISLAVAYEVTVVHRFNRRDFSPQPRVESVLMRIARRAQPVIPVDETGAFRQLVDALFTAWQPTLRDAVKARVPRLAAEHVIRALSLDWRAKVSCITLEQWVELFVCLSQLNDDRIWRDVARHVHSNEIHRRELDRPSRTNVRRSNRPK